MALHETIWRLCAPPARTTAPRFLLSILGFAGALCSGTAALAAEALPELWRAVPATEQYEVRPLRSPAAPEASALEINSAVLSVKPGESLALPAAAFAAGYELLVSENMHFPNGDLSLRGYITSVTGSDPVYPFVLTQGAESLYAHFETREGSFRLDARRVRGTARFRGWLYRTDSRLAGELPVAGDSRDYVIPVRRDRREIERPAAPLAGREALRLGNGSTSVSASARGPEINASNLELRQHFSPAWVYEGGSAGLDLYLENTTSVSHEDLVVDFYFVLEDAQLEGADPACREARTASRPSQKVLRCEVGDLAPGETRSLQYRVLADGRSRPYILSTAVIGDIQDHAFLNVVEDVELDSDGDGASDFDEALLGTDAGRSDSLPEPTAVIDVMALYTAGADALYAGAVETRINQLISIANQIFADSGVEILLRPVYHGRVDYDDGGAMDRALDHLTYGDHPAFADVPALRETYGADLVILFRPLQEGSDLCGLANLGGHQRQGDFSSPEERDYAYSHVAIDCPVSSVVAHELGHNMGLAHSRREFAEGGTFAYSVGHGADGAFTTVMAAPDAFGTDVRMPVFSNPRLDCDGQPCGVDHRDHEEGADAARSLNLVRRQVAAYYPTRVPDYPVRPVATLAGEPEDQARIAIAVSTDGGLTLTESVSAHAFINMDARLFIAPRHAGKQGSLYVVASDGQHFWQLRGDGIISPWDGSMENLRAYEEPGRLSPVEYLRILDHFQPAGFAGQTVQFFVAYRAEDGDFIFTAEPFVLTVTD